MTIADTLASVLGVIVQSFFRLTTSRAFRSVDRSSCGTQSSVGFWCSRTLVAKLPGRPPIQYSGTVGLASDMAVQLLAFALESRFDPQTFVLSAETSHGWIVDSRRWLREIAQRFDVVNLDGCSTHSHPVGNECHK